MAHRRRGLPTRRRRRRRRHTRRAGVDAIHARVTPLARLAVEIAKAAVRGATLRGGALVAEDGHRHPVPRACGNGGWQRLAPDALVPHADRPGVLLTVAVGFAGTVLAAVTGRTAARPLVSATRLVSTRIGRRATAARASGNKQLVLGAAAARDHDGRDPEQQGRTGHGSFRVEPRARPNGSYSSERALGHRPE
jgi:hypothetical protein